jgi:hypothetical protein
MSLSDWALPAVAATLVMVFGNLCSVSEKR